VKCPKCGFVSYAGLEQCKKCGYPFVKAAPKGSSSSLTTLFPEGVRAVSRPPAEPLPKPKENPPRAEPELPTPQASTPEPTPEWRAASKDELSAAGPLRGDESSANWREELSERVANFRNRRARLRPEADSAGNLELDFEDPDKPGDIRSLGDALETSEDRDSGFDLEIGESAMTRDEGGLTLEMVPLEESNDDVMQLDDPPARVEEMSLGEPVAQSRPMEILVDSPTTAAPEEEEEEEATGIFLAPLGRRFLAGLTDLMVLLMGAAVFGIIFWRVCGRLSLVPLNIAVLGFVAVILIFAYFAVFTAIASATPGLLWMGCEIRNLRGDYPTARESFWRAFGVLVSLSALMLGFVWACFDSDGLTWHDHMSGTVITEGQNAHDLASLKAET
jgi:uncharacterized RDD family membrane protein YckC